MVVKIFCWFQGRFKDENEIVVKLKQVQTTVLFILTFRIIWPEWGWRRNAVQCWICVEIVLLFFNN